jgi:hypothetical protein
MIGARQEGSFQRYTFATLGLIASIIILVVSCTMNFAFGCSLGRTPLDCRIYGAASVAADVFMAISPFFFFAAWRNRNVPVVLAAAVVWAVTTTFALASAVGHAALNRLDTTGQRAVVATRYQDIRADLAEARKQLGHVPEHRPEATVRSEIEGHKAKRFWITTSECASPAGAAAREYCQAYWRLDAELGAARDKTRLVERIEQLTSKSDNVSDGHSALSEADPQASVVARLTGFTIPNVQAGLALLVVSLLVVGSGFGPYISLAYLPGPKLPGATAIDITPTPPVDLQPVVGQPQIEAQPLAQTEPASPPPPDPEPAPPSKPTRTALPGSEGQLKAIDFPVERLDGRLRPKLVPKEAARRFAIWVKCHGLAGTHFADQVCALYEEFRIADHREPSAIGLVLQALKTTPGVEFSRPKAAHKQGGTRYTFAPGKFKAPSPPETEVETKEEGRLLSFRPLAGAASPAADVTPTPPMSPIGNVKATLARFVPDQDHSLAALRRLQAHVERRAGRLSRKQRGPRCMRLGWSA